MEIIFNQLTPVIPDYSFNYEAVESFLTEALKNSTGLVITEDGIKAGKATRADLNKLDKQIADKVSEIKKEHNKPFEPFKIQTDLLRQKIKDTSSGIDIQIKAFEQFQKEEKRQLIFDFWNEITLWGADVIDFNRIFNEKWLNASESLNKTKTELLELVKRISGDIEIIKSFNSLDEIPLMSTYMRNFDMSATMRDKANFDRLRAEKIEAERIQAERQARRKQEEAERIAESERQEALKAIYPEPIQEATPALIVEEILKQAPVFETDLLIEESKKQKEQLIIQYKNQVNEWNQQITGYENRINDLKRLVKVNNSLINEIKEELNPSELIGEDEIPF